MADHDLDYLTQRAVPYDRFHPAPEELYTKRTYRESELNGGPAGSIVIWDEQSHTYRQFLTHNDLLQYILALPEESRTFHERIYAKTPQKLRLDIDDKTNTLTHDDIRLIDDAAGSALMVVFGAILAKDYDQIIWCESTDAEKFSFHAIVDGFYVTDHSMARKYAETVKTYLPENLRGYIDTQIYSSAAGLRLPYNKKHNTSRVKKLPLVLSPEIAFERALITNVTHCVELQYRGGFAEQLAKKVITNLTINNTDANLVVGQVKIAHPNYLTGLRVRNIRGCYINFDRISPSPCPISGDIHHSDNTIFIIVGANSAIKCRHCKGALRLSIDLPVAPVAFKPPTIVERREISENRIDYLCNIATISHDLTMSGGDIEEYDGDQNQYGDRMREYPDDIDTIFVKANMGMGKTQSLLRYIQRNNPATILAGSFRISFTVDVVSTLNLVNYQMIKGGISSSLHPKVVVQIESFARLQAEPFELLILDEIESLINQCFSPTHSNAGICWQMFNYMIRFCDKLICVDANLSQYTIDLINDIRQDCSKKLIVNRALPILTVHKVTTIKSAVIQQLCNLVHGGKRVVVPTSSCRTAEEIAKLIADKFPTKQVIAYTSKTPQNVKNRDFANVNAAWVNCDVLVYTPTVMAGISFTVHHFDACVAFWYDTSADVLSCMQMMKRVRNITDGTYIHYVKESINNLPETPNEVVNYVAQSYSRLVKCSPNDFAFPVNRDGSLIIPSDDMRVRAWSQFVANKNKSKNRFLRHLINELKLIGAAVEPLLVSDKKVIECGKKINKYIKVIDAEISTAEFTLVAAARDILCDEFAELKHASDREKDDEYAIKKYIIRRFYKYNGIITIGWLSMYYPQKIKTQYLIRKRVAGFDGMSANTDDLSQIVLRGFETAKSPEMFDRLFDVSRDRVCLEFLVMFGFKFRNPDNLILTRAELFAKLKANHRKLTADCPIVCKLFGVKTSKLPPSDDPAYLKKMLEYVNGKLSFHYNVKIKATDKHSVNYTLSDSFTELFDVEFKPIKQA